MTRASARRLFNKGKTRAIISEEDKQAQKVHNKKTLAKRRKKNKISALSKRKNRKG